MSEMALEAGQHNTIGLGQSSSGVAAIANGQIVLARMVEMGLACVMAGNAWMMHWNSIYKKTAPATVDLSMWS